MIDFGIIHHMPTEGNPVYIKQLHLQEAHWVNTHAHNFDHYGILGKGVALVELDGKEDRYEAPCVIEIKGGKKHKITAVEAITWFCVHATFETDAGAIDTVLIKEN